MTIQREKTWEDETLELIQEAEQERHRAIQKVEVAKRAVELAEQRMAALKTTLGLYHQKYGIATNAIIPSKEMAAEYAGMNPQQMIEHRADMNDGTVIMNDLAKDTVAAGMFSSVVQARGTLYRRVARMSGFEKVTPGIYRLVKAKSTISSNGKEPDYWRCPSPSIP